MEAIFKRSYSHLPETKRYLKPTKLDVKTKLKEKLDVMSAAGFQTEYVEDKDKPKVRGGLREDHI